MVLLREVVTEVILVWVLRGRVGYGLCDIISSEWWTIATNDSKQSVCVCERERERERERGKEGGKEREREGGREGGISLRGARRDSLQNPVTVNVSRYRSTLCLGPDSPLT